MSCLSPEFSKILEKSRQACKPHLCFSVLLALKSSQQWLRGSFQHRRSPERRSRNSDFPHASCSGWGVPPQFLCPSPNGELPGKEAGNLQPLALREADNQSPAGEVGDPRFCLWGKNRYQRGESGVVTGL